MHHPMHHPIHHPIRRNSHSPAAGEPRNAVAPVLEKTSVLGPPTPPAALPSLVDSRLPKTAQTIVDSGPLTAQQGRLTRRLAMLFGPILGIPKSNDATEAKTEHVQSASVSDANHTSMSIPSTLTTLNNGPSTTPTLGTLTLTRQPTSDKNVSPIGTTAQTPSLPQQSDMGQHLGRQGEVPPSLPSLTASASSGRFSDAKSDTSRSSGSKSFSGSQVSSLVPGHSFDWFFSVGRSADIGRSFSSSAATADAADAHGPPTRLAAPNRPPRPPPAIVIDTCAFVSRFGTANVYTEPSDDVFISRYSPHVNAWSRMYDPADGSRLDPARDPVSFTVAKFGQHRKTVAWAAMEALRYWLLARTVPVVPLVAFQMGYRTLVAAEPGKVAETLIEYLRSVICDEGDWGTFTHIVRHARKEAQRYSELVEWMAKDWGSALAQVEDRGEWRSEWELAKWMEGTMMPVMVVLLKSRSLLD